MKEIVVKFSGGTDSTAATALVAENYDKVHLVTYKHSGLSNIENSGRNIDKLRELYGHDKFVHVIMDIDKLFRSVTYSNYLRSVLKFGVFNLTTCGLCKLAMHIRTLIYCVDNGVTEVADGANKNSDHFPAQMEPVLAEFRNLYRRFGITFTNPVFDYEFPQDTDWKHKFGLVKESRPPQARMTTGQILSSRGILKKDNVKGTAIDRKMQARCFQLTLLNLVALKYYIPRYGMDSYREGTVCFYRDKIKYFSPEIERYLENREKSCLSRVIDNQWQSGHDS